MASKKRVHKKTHAQKALETKLVSLSRKLATLSQGAFTITAEAHEAGLSPEQVHACRAAFEAVQRAESAMASAALSATVG